MIPVIARAYEQWPLPGYLNVVKKTIDEALHEQIAAKNIKNITMKDFARMTNLPTQLSHVKSRGVQTVAEKLFVTIRQITKKEEKRALNEALRAAAQHRLLLPGVVDETIGSLMQWIYRGTLHYQDTEHLYAILQLATTLGVEALTEVCLTKLYDVASENIQDISNSGLPLRNLLVSGPDSVDSALGVIFKHVIQDKCTPKRLQELIIDTLAASLDKELWKEVKILISHEMALEIIEAMLDIGQQIKSEVYKDHVKAEN